MDTPQADNENKSGSLQCLCHQHAAIRQRDMNYVCQTGEKTQHLPPVQRRGPVSCWLSQYVHSVQAALAGSCPRHGRWLHPKRHPLWIAGIMGDWPPTAAIQERLHERHDGARHGYSILGGPCRWPHEVQKYPEPTRQDSGRETDKRRSQVDTQKGAQ